MPMPADPLDALVFGVAFFGMAVMLGSTFSQRHAGMK
jgi:hypothetical protein